VRYHAAVLAVAGLLAYAGSFAGPFLFDDQNAVVKNTTIRTLTPLSVPLSPPRDTPVAGRPVINLTFAANYAIGGLDVTGYHVVNLAVHLLTALLLFGVVRRTLRLPSMPDDVSRHASGVALTCALVWELHPLNSEAVNYVAQRTESVMGLCYVLTLYAAIRAAAHPQRWGWRLGAIATCAIGMASKESMVTAPVMVLLYDRVFLYPSFRAAVRERGALYLGLVATWGVLAVLLLGGPRTSVGFGAGVTPWTYFLNQLSLIARYLWLAVWPRELVFDYGLPRPLTVGDVWLPGAFVVAAGLLTLVALRLRPALGFLGAWFFVTLGPTSSVVPIATEVGAERRMYLPLMAIAILGTLGVFAVLAARRLLVARIPQLTAAVVCLLLAAGTVLRTREYQNVRSIAQANVDRYPHGRARLSLASELVAANEHSAALAQLEEAIKDYPPAHLALATELATSGRMDDAVTHAQEFIRLMPGNAEVPTARDLMGRALALQGKYEPAAEQFNLLAYARPNDPAPLVSMGDVRLRQRRLPESIASYESALRMRPGDPDILGQLGLALAAAGRMPDASLAFGGAVSARPTDLRLLNLWGRTLAAEGRYVDAVVPMRRVAELAPSDGQAVENLRIMERLAAQQGAGGRRPSVAIPQTEASQGP